MPQKPLCSPKPGEVRNPNGKPKGTKNMRTVELEQLALRAMSSAAARKAMGTPLAREVLAWSMDRYYSMAQSAWKNQDEERALVFTDKASDVAAKLAPYESPRLESIMVHKADPYMAMSDDQLYATLIERGRKIGISHPSTPVLIEGVANKDGGGDD